MTTVFERFVSKVNITGPDECWEWRARKNPNGYGMFSLNGKMARAHRVAWEMTNGPIPDGLCVLHDCDVPVCVNPGHLWLGTQLDNMRDRSRKGRAIKGSRHPRAKLTAPLVAEIRQRYASGDVTIRELASAYGVGRETIRVLILRNTWKHVQ